MAHSSPIPTTGARSGPACRLRGGPGHARAAGPRSPDCGACSGWLARSAARHPRYMEATRPRCSSVLIRTPVVGAFAGPARDPLDLFLFLLEAAPSRGRSRHLQLAAWRSTSAPLLGAQRHGHPQWRQMHAGPSPHQHGQRRVGIPEATISSAWSALHPAKDHPLPSGSQRAGADAQAALCLHRGGWPRPLSARPQQRATGAGDQSRVGEQRDGGRLQRLDALVLCSMRKAFRTQSATAAFPA